MNPSESMSQPKLLIADDERHVADGLKLILSDDGYKTEMATDGEEAWQKVQSGEFGIVLADLMMPGMDGLELFAKMREEGIVHEDLINNCAEYVDTAVLDMPGGY